MKRGKDEDAFDIVEFVSSYMELQALDASITSMLSVEIEMKIRVILEVPLSLYL